MSFLYIILIIIAVVVYLIYKKQKPAVISSNSSVSEKRKLAEEDITKRQLRFEKNIELDLPDRISRQEIYIYSKLMSVWYDKLSSNNRYNDEMIQKIRNDWIDYMNSLEERSTCNYLSLEAESEEETEKYRDEHIIASKKVFAIEDAFASMIGKEAVEELARIHKLSILTNFDKEGNIAPEGFQYSGFGSEKKLVKIEKSK